jgi:hypothetical protein
MRACPEYLIARASGNRGLADLLKRLMEDLQLLYKEA